MYINNMSSTVLHVLLTDLYTVAIFIYLNIYLYAMHIFYNLYKCAWPPLNFLWTAWASKNNQVCSQVERTVSSVQNEDQHKPFYRDMDLVFFDSLFDGFSQKNQLFYARIDSTFDVFHVGSILNRTGEYPIRKRLWQPPVNLKLVIGSCLLTIAEGTVPERYTGLSGSTRRL